MTSKIAKKIDSLCSPIVEFSRRRHEYQLEALFRGFLVKRSLRRLLAAGRLLLQLALSYLLAPICYFSKLLGYRFLMVDLTQIGSILFLDLFIRENLTTRKSPSSRIIVCRSQWGDANRFILDLYSPYVTFVSKPIYKLLLTPFFVSDVSGERVFQFEASRAFHGPPEPRRVRLAEVFNAYSCLVGGTLVRLNAKQIEDGRRAVSGLIDLERPIVTLHVRDSGFYGDLERTTRNADIGTYERAIRYLIDQGYTVVRMGDPAMLPIDDMVARCGRNLVDYAHSSWRSDFMDCFLIAESEFFIGCASGLWSLAIVLGTRCCNVNYFTASTCLGMNSEDLSIFKKFRYSESRELVPLKRIMLPPFTSNPQFDELASIGVDIEDNSPEEILEAVAEFVGRNFEKPSELQALAKKLMVSTNYSYGCAGNFAESFLKLYFPKM
jgi:putative glycosyltransferase (TIGR04372 family)